MTEDIRSLEEIAMFREWASLRSVSSRSIPRAMMMADALEISRRVSAIPIIGIVGSKGKGTAAVYASATIAGGSHTVGTIFSPGLKSNRDRVRMNGRILSDELYRDMLLSTLQATSSLPLATKDTGYLSPNGLFMLSGISTLIKHGCQALVVEAGIGGRSDELSVLPLRTVAITQIFDEHREILGPTRTDIATDKVGVVSDRTTEVFSLAQDSPVSGVIQKRCAETGSQLTWVSGTSSRDVEETLPPGYGRMNAVLGVSSGAALCRAMDGKEVKPDSLRKVLSSINYPGRLSEHASRSGRVIVDSAISRDGFVTSLYYARSRFGRDPDKVLVSIPLNKDFDGFKRELASLAAQKIFVDMPGIHLPYPDRNDWDWSWTTIDEVSDIINDGLVLAVGTVLFSGAMLDKLAVDTSKLFEVCE